MEVACFYRKVTHVIYDVRPAACKLEPLIISDYDHENNMIILDITPVALFDPQLSCKGISAQETLLVEEIAKLHKRQFRKYWNISRD